MSTTSEPRPVLVLDMSTLRLKQDRGPRAPVRVTMSSGVVLAVVHPRKDEGSRDLAFRCFEAALDHGVVLVPQAGPAPDRCMPVALYNPLSGDVSLGPTPSTVTLSCHGALELEQNGTVGYVDASGQTLTIGAVVLEAVDRSPSELTRLIAQQVA